MFSRSMATRAAVAAGLLASLAAGGCVRKPDSYRDPKKVLADYISRSFHVTSLSDRQALLAFLSHDARSRLSAWSDDQFREAFIEEKRQFLKLSFVELKRISPGELAVTYELSYVDKGKGHDARITQKKLAEMVRDQGSWTISDVRNIKELVEYQDEMALP